MQRYSHSLSVLIFLLFSSLLAGPAFGSDVYIRVGDNEVGQGIMRMRGAECLLIAPAHVVENGFKIDLTFGDRTKHSAEILELFPGDISVLRLKGDDSSMCRHASWSEAADLNVLLEVEKQGELRTMLADGSIRITPVDIVAYDKYRNINVRPQNRTDAIAKGESGSLLYIGGKLAGMLLFVKDDIGNVIRQDALINILALFFGETHQAGRNGAASSPRPSAAPPPAQERLIPKLPGEHGFSGIIVQSAVAEHRIRLEENSPIRLTFSATEGRGRYTIEIMDSSRKVVFRDAFKRSTGTETLIAPFTAPKSDTYTLYLTGTEGEVKYTVKMAPIALDAHLRNEANVLYVGGNAVSGVIAQGAVAAYRIKLEANSPIRLVFAATGDQGKYQVEVWDSTGKTVYRAPSRRYSGTETATAYFTAPKSDTYSLRIVGTESEGRYALKVQPIVSDKQLRGEANVLQVGGIAGEGVIAEGAIAEYRIRLEANSPIRLNFAPTGDPGRFNVEILDSTGKTVYRDPYKILSGKETAAIPFNPSKEDTYALRIIGIEGEGRYSMTVLPATGKI